MNKKLELLYQETLKEKITTIVYDFTNIFSDDPQMFFYIAPRNPDYHFYSHKSWDYTGTGGSFTSRQEALLKALVEVNEKLTLQLFNPQEVIYTSYNNIEKDAIDPTVYLKAFDKHNASNRNVHNIIIGWEEGFNLTKNKHGFIPCQLIHPNYLTYASLERQLDEPLLLYQTQVFNGSGGGFDRESVVLRAIYELVERDTHRNLVLSKSIPPVVDLTTVDNPKIRQIINLSKSYQLYITVFDITNDLQIPSFMTMIVDPTCIGPVLNFGFKADLDPQKAILHSIEDVFYSRFGFRKMVLTEPNSPLLIYLKEITVNGKKYTRNVYLKKDTYKRFNYLFARKNYKKSKLDYSSYENQSTKKKLQTIMEKLEKKGFDIWYKLINSTLHPQSKLNIYKVIIPGLQLPHTTEISNNFFQDRVQATLQFYNRYKTPQ